MRGKIVDSNKPATLTFQIDQDIKAKLDECARKEKRTKRAVIELALEQYFAGSPAFNSDNGGRS